MGVSRRSRMRSVPSAAPARILPSTRGEYYRLWNGGPWAIRPKQLPQGWQNTRLRVPLRRATCAEVDCQRFLKGWVDPVTEKYFPPGTPCPDGLAGAHTTWDGTPLKYTVQMGGQYDSSGNPITRTVEETEFIDRLCEGYEATAHILTRGL